MYRHRHRFIIWVVVKMMVPFLGPLNTTCSIMLRTQKGTTTWTTTHIPLGSYIVGKVICPNFMAHLTWSSRYQDHLTLPARTGFDILGLAIFPRAPSM